MRRNRGQLAAWLAFGYSLAIALWVTIGSVLARNGGWSGLVGVPLLSIPLVITAIGAFARGRASTRFKIRLVAAILMALEVTVGFFWLGLLFIPAAVASVVSAVQAKSGKDH